MIQYIRVALYTTQNKKVPLNDWLHSLDPKTRKRVSNRIYRLCEGLLGDCKRINSGLIEIRLDFGPGYRIYGTITSNRTLVLLCGGTKARQQRDIEMAMKYCKSTDKGQYYEL